MAKRTAAKKKVADSEYEENLVQAIKKISAAAARLSESGLNRRAIVVLLHDATKVNKAEINKILDGLEDLKRNYAR